MMLPSPTTELREVPNSAPSTVPTAQVAEGSPVYSVSSETNITSSEGNVTSPATGMTSSAAEATSPTPVMTSHPSEPPPSYLECILGT